jgi:hypothetical protein
MLRRCMTLTYNAIEHAESSHIDNRRGMKDFYRSVKDVGIPSCWKVAVNRKLVSGWELVSVLSKFSFNYIFF